MIQLGKIQKLQIIRHSDFGVYMNTPNNQTQEDILLPRKQVPEGAEIGDEVEVFVYRDSEDRLIATTEQPKLTIGNVAYLRVAEITRIGAFLEWGLQKDLFLPFKEQEGKVEKDKSYLVGLYVDKSDRLCATMKVYDVLSCQSPYKVNGRVKGIVYRIQPELGVMVAVEGEFHGMIPNQEIFGTFKVGDQIEARIKKVRPDGKLELTTRKQMLGQMEEDSKRIMDTLEKNGGKLALHDKSAPEIIKRELNMSKASFKRALGRLLKEGAITISDTGISRNW
ncbi:MAG: CvfB family protein [Cellulosilyticaceae bacterium]